MDIRIVLTKILTLIYRSRLVDNLENDDLMRTVLSTVKTDSPEFSFGNTNIPKKLKDFCIELLEDKEPIAKEVILPRLSLMLEKDPKLSSTLKESIEVDYDDPGNKRVVTSLIKNLYAYYRESQATDILNKISYDIKFNRSKITNFNEYLRDTIAKLEPLSLNHSTIKDPAVVNEVDFASEETLNMVFEEVKNLNNNKSIYKYGWQALNRATQGGLRRGEFVTVGALQHKYKTGASLSMFAQIAQHNSPVVTKEEAEAGKKPLLLRISFEDNLTNNLQFMYQYLKANEGEPVAPKDFETLTAKTMSTYILAKLTATGFHIKMMRVDPSQWTYSSVMNKVIELEAQGYAVHVLMLDYITLLPTTGCAQGVAGADKKDLMRKVRNFCSARNIACITPLQLSSEAKTMIRNGIPEHDFVNQIAEKGYYDGCKSLDQDIDCELFLHLFTHKKKKYISVRRGKHRISTVISDEDKFFMLRFPSLNVPVLEDVAGQDTSFSRLPRGGEEGAAGDLLEEMLG